MFKPIRTCQLVPDCDSPCEGNTDGCATHNKELRKAGKASLKEKKIYTINKKTAKLASAEAVYLKNRKPWLEGKVCAVYPKQIATQVHHMKGRGFGYADMWAKERGIILLHDQRFWLAVSADGHEWINNNDGEARKKGFVLSRLENLDYDPETV